MKKYLLLTIATICMAFSCQKEPNPVVIEEPCLNCPDSSKPLLVWQQALTSNIDDTGAITPVLYDGKVLFGLQFISDYEPLLCLDASTGNKLWLWNEQLSAGYSSEPSIYTRNNKYIAYKEGEINIINMDNGQTVFAKNSTAGSRPRCQLIANNLYHAQQPDNFDVDECYMVRTDIDAYNFDTLFVFSKTNGYRPGIEPPSLWINPEGDSILILQNRQFNFPALDGKIDIHAFNLKTRQTMWVLEDIDLEGNSNVHPPVISNNKAFFLGQQTVYCIDLINHNVKWSYRPPTPSDNFQTGTAILPDETGQLYVKSNWDHLYALNPDTGALIWQTTEGGLGSADLIYHDHTLYYTASGDGKLYAINTDTHKVKWVYKTPNSSGNFGITGVALDPIKRLLYTADNYYAMCIKIPD